MAGEPHVLTSKVLLNSEYERKKEFERRRVLRIKQSREQIKDFQDKLRESVRAETQIKNKAALKNKIRQLQHNKKEELKRLKDVYEISLQKIGESHIEAAKQPDINLLKQVDAAEKSSDAAVRGITARKRQTAQTILHDQQIQAPIQHKRLTRNRENMRSLFVSSLPTNSRGYKKILSGIPDKTQTVSCELDKSADTLEDVPKPQTLQARKQPPLEYNTEPNKLSCKKAREPCKELSTDNPADSKAQLDCSCDYLVCDCHISGKGIRARCFSESTVVTDCSLVSKKPKLRSLSCSSPTIRTLNYCSSGNVYESKERNFSKVTRHPKPTHTELKDPIPNVEIDLTIQNKQEKNNLVKKTEERGAKALKKEKVIKDFKRLIDDIEHFSRAKSVARSKNKAKAKVFLRERDILSKKELNQRKLIKATEEVLSGSIKNTSSKSRDRSTNIQSPSSDCSSPPTLNLATCHQVNKENATESPVSFVFGDELSVSVTPTVMSSSGYSQSPRQSNCRSRPLDCPNIGAGHVRYEQQHCEHTSNISSADNPHRCEQFQRRDDQNSTSGHDCEFTGRHPLTTSSVNPHTYQQFQCRGVNNSKTVQDCEHTSRHPFTPTAVNPREQFQCRGNQNYENRQDCDHTHRHPPTISAVKPHISEQFQIRGDTNSKNENYCKGSHRIKKPSYDKVDAECPDRGTVDTAHVPQKPTKEIQKVGQSEVQFHETRGTPDSLTSYCTVPEELKSCSKRLYNFLLTQDSTKGMNKELMQYIQQLLNMTRESIENLSISPTHSGDSSLIVNVDDKTLQNSPCLQSPTVSKYKEQHLPSTTGVNCRIDAAAADTDTIAQMIEIINDYVSRVNDVVLSCEEKEDCPSPSVYMDLPTSVESDPYIPNTDHCSGAPPYIPTTDPCKASPSPNLNKLQNSSQRSSTNIATRKYPNVSRSECPYLDKPLSEPSQQKEKCRKSQSPLKFIFNGVQAIQAQTPFGISSNLLPKPADIFQPLPTSPKPQLPRAPECKEALTSQNLQSIPECPARVTSQSPNRSGCPGNPKSQSEKSLPECPARVTSQSPNSVPECPARVTSQSPNSRIPECPDDLRAQIEPSRIPECPDDLRAQIEPRDAGCPEGSSLHSVEPCDDDTLGSLFDDSILEPCGPKVELSNTVQRFEQRTFCKEIEELDTRFERMRQGLSPSLRCSPKSKPDDAMFDDDGDNCRPHLPRLSQMYEPEPYVAEDECSPVLDKARFGSQEAELEKRDELCLSPQNLPDVQDRIAYESYTNEYNPEQCQMLPDPLCNLEEVPYEPELDVFEVRSGSFINLTTNSGQVGSDNECIPRDETHSGGRQLDCRSSPLSLLNVRKRISDTRFVNYHRIMSILENETDEERDRLLGQICDTTNCES